LNVEFTPEALADLRNIQSYIAETDPAAADRLISRIRQTITMSERFPLLGRAGSIEGTREFVIPGLPYTVIYQIQSETTLDILTIIHQSRQYPPQQD
jgi:toxin ParE1/3/4